VVAVAGAGPLGAAAALGLAHLGVARLVLIDGACDALGEVGATLGAAPGDAGRPRAENRARPLRALRAGDGEVVAVPRPLRLAGTAEALRDADLLVTADEGPAGRQAALGAARRWAKTHLALTASAGPDGVTGEAVLRLPGCCVACPGGETAGPRPAEAVRPALATVCQAVAGLGLQAWLEVLAGHQGRGSRLRLAWGPDGLPRLTAEASCGAACCPAS
jgi:hypothetical protein